MIKNLVKLYKQSELYRMSKIIFWGTLNDWNMTQDAWKVIITVRYTFIHIIWRTRLIITARWHGLVCLIWVSFKILHELWYNLLLLFCINTILKKHMIHKYIVFYFFIEKVQNTTHNHFLTVIRFFHNTVFP